MEWVRYCRGTKLTASEASVSAICHFVSWRAMVWRFISSLAVNPQVRLPGFRQQLGKKQLRRALRNWWEVCGTPSACTQTTLAPLLFPDFVQLSQSFFINKKLDSHTTSRDWIFIILDHELLHYSTRKN